MKTQTIRAAIAAALTIAAALPTSALTGSSPHRIAKDVTTTLCGDANCDGQVDFSDSIAILQHLGTKDKYQLSETGMANADVDGNAGVTANDARCIQMFVAGLLPDLGGQSSIGTPNADLGPVRLMMRDGSGHGGQDQDRMTARPGEHVYVDVYVNRTDMRLGGIFLRLGGELPKGVDVYMEDNYAYAFDGNKEYFQVGNFFLCDTLRSGEPQEVDSTQPLLQFELRLPADLKSGEYMISPIDFCQLFEDGTSHIFDVSYSPLVLCVPEEGGALPPTRPIRRRPVRATRSTAAKTRSPLAGGSFPAPSRTPPASPSPATRISSSRTARSWRRTRAFASRRATASRSGRSPTAMAWAR